MSTILVILAMILFNFALAAMSRSFWSEFLDEKEFFCKLWLKVLLVIPPIGIVAGIFTLVVILLGCLVGCVYMVLIEPIIDYFKNCDI